MIKTQTLLLKLSKRFPKRMAAKYDDHVGLMCGHLPENTRKILLCLDMDEIILGQVLNERPDLVITHHPFIFGTRYQVFKNDPKKKLLAENLEAHAIPVISFHTNFDEGPGGMNDALAQALGLHNVQSMIGAPMGRIGDLPSPMPVRAFARYAKKALNTSYGLLIANGKPEISRVAIIGGGGARSYSFAQSEGADIYISGDVPHHVRRGIVTDHYNYLDLPHEIERIFMPTMKAILLSIDPTLEIVVVDHEELPEVI